MIAESLLRLKIAYERRFLVRLPPNDYNRGILWGLTLTLGLLRQTQKESYRRDMGWPGRPTWRCSMELYKVIHAVDHDLRHGNRRMAMLKLTNALERFKSK